MREWEKLRDWELKEAIDELPENSYDLVGRDIWMKNGVKADFLKYRSEGNIVEARFYHDDQMGVSGEEVREALRKIGDLLLEERFRQPNLSITTPGSIRRDYDTDLSGRYFLDPESDYDTVKANLDSLTPQGRGLDELERIIGKK